MTFPSPCPWIDGRAEQSRTDDPKSHRRAVYRFIVRSQPQPFMSTLDCADPSNLTPKS